MSRPGSVVLSSLKGIYTERNPSLRRKLTSRSITGTIGFPAVLQEDWATNRACEVGNKYSLPKDLRHQALIYKMFSRINQVMAGNLSSSTGFPAESEQASFMRLLECDVDDLEREMVAQGVSSLSFSSKSRKQTDSSISRKSSNFDSYTLTATLLLFFRDLYLRFSEAGANQSLCHVIRTRQYSPRNRRRWRFCAVRTRHCCSNVDSVSTTANENHQLQLQQVRRCGAWQAGFQ